MLIVYPGAMVLAHSLKDNGTRKQLAILITLDALAASTVEELKVRPIIYWGKHPMLTAKVRLFTIISFLSIS